MRDFCVLKAGKGGHNWSVFCFSFFGRVTGFSGLSSEKTEQDFFCCRMKRGNIVGREMVKLSEKGAS